VSSEASTINDNVYVFAEHVFFSDSSPDIGEQIFVFAYINYKGTNAPLGPFTVTLNDILPVAGALQTITVGSAMVGFAAGQSDSPQVVVIPYTNTAAGPHITQIDTSPPAANVNPLDDDATRLLFVGPPDPTLDVQKTAVLLVDADGNGVVTPGDTLGTRSSPRTAARPTSPMSSSTTTAMSAGRYSRQHHERRDRVRRRHQLGPGNHSCRRFGHADVRTSGCLDRDRGCDPEQHGDDRQQRKRNRFRHLARAHPDQRRPCRRR
jgi:hypothetical protein